MGRYAEYLASHGKERPGILIYLEILDALEDFSDEEAGQLLKAALLYGKTGKATDFEERAMKILFRRLREQIDCGAESWEKSTMSGLYGPYKREAKKNGEEVLEFDAWADRELQNMACIDNDPLSGWR